MSEEHRLLLTNFKFKREVESLPRISPKEKEKLTTNVNFTQNKKQESSKRLIIVSHFLQYAGNVTLQTSVH